MSNPISRRELLKWASAGAGAAAVGSATYRFGRSGQPLAGPVAVAASSNTMTTERQPQETTAPPPSSVAASLSAVTDVGQRLLVVVEMSGGNDGMSMVVPYGMGSYYDLRRYTAIAEGDVLALDGEVGLHGSLPKLHARGAAVLQGVGSWEPDGSHFEMLARWWNGSQYAGNAYSTGFLGRLADAIGDPAAAAVALSVGTGSHPTLVSQKVGTLSIPSASAAYYVAGAGDDDPFRQRFQRSFAAMGAAGDAGATEARLRQVMAQTESFAYVLGGIEDEGDNGDDQDGYSDTPLARGLQLAARLFATESGVRIVHVPMQQDFDTHDDHNGRYPGMMQDLDDSLHAFMTDLDQRGLSDRVLVMTTSEFGRTARDNDSGGLDHGAASNALLLGPVNAGRHGQYPSLDDLDDNGNLKATVGFDQYYATVAEHWFGVPCTDLLDGGVTPIDGIISAG